MLCIILQSINVYDKHIYIYIYCTIKLKCVELLYVKRTAAFSVYSPTSVSALSGLTAMF